MRKLVMLLLVIALIAAVPVGAQSTCLIVNGRQLSCSTTTAKGVTSPGTIRGFDPQPDPPSQVNNLPGTGFDAVGFNPQPDPPRVMAGDGSV